jgi:hypothetical protein
MSHNKTNRRESNRPRLGEFLFRSNDRIGYADATEDTEILRECFVDTGVLSDLEDMDSPQVILVGRTGSGKTALLQVLASRHERARLLNPSELAIPYVANSTILTHVSGLGVKLAPFYKLLWRHILAEEILRRYVSDGPGVWDRLLAKVGQQTRYRKAADYLRQWENRFWSETEARVTEVVRSMENQLQAEVGADLHALKNSARGSTTATETLKTEVMHKCQKIVASAQVKELGSIPELLNAVLDDRQKAFYLLIDRLDENWVATTVRYELTLALLEVAKEFISSVKNAKVIVAIRRDLLEKVFREARSVSSFGLQKEKFESLMLPLHWTGDSLRELLDKRVGRLIRMKYTGQRVGYRDVLPSTFRGGSIDDVLGELVSRPRDIIHLFNECIKHSEGSAKIESKQFGEALGAFSRSRFDALMEEWMELYPQLQHFAGILKGMPDSFKLHRIDQGKLASLCLDIAVDVDSSTTQGSDLLSSARRVAESAQAEPFVLDLAKCFYTVGLAGLKVDPFGKAAWIDEGSRTVSAAEITMDSSIEVHPAFRRVLGIVESR